MICHYFDETSYLIFADGVPPLLYYSHIPVIILAMLVGLFVFLNQPTRLLNRLLLLITVSFSAWTFINLIAWTHISSQLLITIWPFFAIFSGFIAIYSIYFVRVFISGHDIPPRTKWLFAALLAPLLVFAATDLTVSGFNISDCDAFGYEGFFSHTYNTLLGVLAIVWIAFEIGRAYFTKTLRSKSELFLMGIGTEFFLITFLFFTTVASYLANAGYVTNSDFEFYGLFGMAFFVAMMGTLIVKFKSFNVGASASVALTIGLLILTGSQFTYVESRTGVGITTITLVLTGIIAILLLRSIRNEIKQRKEIETLADDLQKANTRLKKLDKQKSEFVSIASHQLRSPLTSIRGYASMLLEGSFGTVPDRAKESIERIESSAKNMAMAVEDYLNVSRIESGNMKYELSDFNLKEEIEHVTDDLRAAAMKEKLVLLFRSDINSRSIVNADVGKVVQIAHNLINNAIKYTEKGNITVCIHDDVKAKKIYVDVTDSGVGMSEETLHSIFQKFSRAADANKVNTQGTGLGLFVAQKMAQDMGGTITAHSNGPGKGSRFTLELPLAM